MNEKFHGEGVLTYADGGIYVGKWRENKKHGYGSQSWPNGNKYGG